MASVFTFLYPASAHSGTQGLPIPDPVNLARVARERPAHACLAAPAEYESPPDLSLALHAIQAEELYAALLDVGGSQPRTALSAAYPTRLQAHFVCRTERMNLPILIVVEALDTGAGSTALLYMQSVYARPGARALRRMADAWGAALEKAVSAQARG